jgi:predicted transcriptional regulator of viral defense system
MQIISDIAEKKTSTLSPGQLNRLGRRGKLQRVAQGVYWDPESELTEHHDLAVVAAAIPKGRICLLSALQFHGLGNEWPHEVWVALDPTSHPPRKLTIPIRVLRFSGPSLDEGLETHVLEGVRVRITSQEKTIADCFKYRNKFGLDVAMEALRDYIRRPNHDLENLRKSAKFCRVENVMRPYLEMLLH